MKSKLMMVSILASASISTSALCHEKPVQAPVSKTKLTNFAQVPIAECRNQTIPLRTRIVSDGQFCDRNGLLQVSHVPNDPKPQNHVDIVLDQGHALIQVAISEGAVRA
jgi:hypothetical protein